MWYRDNGNRSFFDKNGGSLRKIDVKTIKRLIASENHDKNQKTIKQVKVLANHSLSKGIMLIWQFSRLRKVYDNDVRDDGSRL